MSTESQNLTAQVQAMARQLDADFHEALTVVMFGIDPRDGRRFYESKFGRRILAEEGAFGQLSENELRNLLGLASSGYRLTFDGALNAGAIPAPDHRRKGWLSWDTSTIAQWASRGCPGRNGRPNPELATAIGF